VHLKFRKLHLLVHRSVEIWFPVHNKFVWPYDLFVVFVLFFLSRLVEAENLHGTKGLPPLDQGSVIIINNEIKRIFHCN